MESSEIIITPDENTITIGTKTYSFVANHAPDMNYDCDHCAFNNTDTCEFAPCSMERLDETKGYFIHQNN